MGVLSVVLRLEVPRLGREIILAVNGSDILSRCGLRLLGDTQAVGSHIGDESDCTHSGNIDTFVKLLRSFHCTLCAEAELP